MASASRTFTRALRTAGPNLRTPSARSARYAVPQYAFRAQSRGYASESEPKEKYEGNPKGMLWGAVGLLTLAAGYGLYRQKPELFGQEAKAKGPFVPKYEDYQKVYDAVAKKLQDEDDYDDGSYGPVLLRLAWHASGTYDAETGTGGSNGATMRFAPEGDHGANAGLKAARDFLEPIKEQFPWISYSDLWILSGICAIQEMQGPKIPFRPGRTDRDVSFCTPDGRLPDASKDRKHIRAIFGRMGFDDREMVALSGAHALGRCHTDRSGYDGPWTFSPTTLTNDYYKLLLEEKWQWKKWNGPKQYEDVKTKSLMMLPTDMEIVKDKTFRKHAERYAKDNDVFFKEFADAVLKLFELGVPFTVSEDQRWTFKSSFD
ncbi:cytochrome c peroxidase mitochondrial precursor [Westerdykella ornata]|uniref:Peroxidase n=1 Tax=Westerdykella ornata TaxID=318751 RepID=A0A6A6JVJ0_WESOR|nr:cytochrome c peroxidase mitochondrial precursor [Westerdykella ornata]KAF2280631.1 cytochrome c peroxidase mitochondrial precursor [Westerdykella ornata]